MPASFNSQGQGTVTGALSSFGALSENPAMLQLILSGMTQGSGLIPSMNSGFNQVARPAPMADWGPLPQQQMPVGAGPNDISGILEWLKTQGLSNAEPMAGPLMGGYR